jgi:hypothetical protein
MTFIENYFDFCWNGKGTSIMILKNVMGNEMGILGLYMAYSIP